MDRQTIYHDILCYATLRAIKTKKAVLYETLVEILRRVATEQHV